MNNINSEKTKNILQVVFVFALCTIAMGNFLYPNHIAVPNIAGVVAICTAVLHFILFRQITFDKKILISYACIGLFPLIYLISLHLHPTEHKNWNYYFQVRAISTFYAAIFILAPPVKVNRLKYVFFCIYSHNLLHGYLSIYEYFKSKC